MFTLTPNEREILELMWSENRSLSRSEIMELLPNKSWSGSSIHILLNKLLEKGAIVADGFFKVGKSVGRTYASAITDKEYMLMQMKHGFGLREKTPMGVAEIFAALVSDKDINSETINELEKILDEKKKDL